MTDPADSRPSLKKNFLLNISLSGINVVFPLLVLTYGARVLGPSPMGAFFLASNLAAYFLVLSNGAISAYGIREVGKNAGNAILLSRTIGELFILNFLINVIAGMTYLAVSLCFPKFQAHSPIFLAMGAILMVQAISTDFIFQGLERYAGVAWRSLLSKGTTLLGIGLFVRNPSDTLLFAIMVSMGPLIGNLLGLVEGRRLTRLDFNAGILWERFQSLLPMFAFFLIASLYVNFDSILLGMLADEYAVGLYNIAMKATRTVIALIASVGVVVVPRITFYLENNRLAEFRDLTRRSVDLLLMLSFLGGSLLYFSAPVLIPLLFGPEFAPSAATLQLSVPNVLIVTLSGFMGMQILFPMRKENVLIAATAAGSLVGLGVGALLIPAYRQNGSAIASLLAELASFSMLFAYCHRAGIYLPFFEKRNLVYPCCAAMISIPALLAVHLRGPSSTYVLTAAAIGALCSAMVLARYRRDMLDEIISLVRKVLGRVLGMRKP